MNIYNDMVVINTFSITDLRIGNWMLFDCKPGRIAFMDLDLQDELEELVASMENYGDAIPIRSGRIQPIILTEDILLRHGFKEENGSFWIHGELGIRLAGSTQFTLKQLDGFLDMDPYFHSLQNIIYETLKLKLDYKKS